MAGMIPRAFIDDLLTRVDVVDVINARVPLKKKGREYTTCCPFHSEKTPSFTVSPVKQFYHCFGCGVHGTAIDFLMEYEHLDFVEAIETLAQSLGLDVPREKGQAASRNTQKNKNLYDLMQEVSTYYQQQLASHSHAQDYLQQRGLSSEIIARFQIGYVPEAWDLLLKTFSPRYTPRQMLDAGLLIEKEDGGRQYDRFRDRIMFPIRDKRGRTIGFGGRVLGDGTPKYLNSPETEIFHKGSELYGFYEARQHTRKLERLLVVEGYMDVIALAQFDISYAVATLGTATTQEHVSQIFRAVNEVIFCFDGDRAGRDAAWRALQNALSVLRDGKEIRFMFLPAGEDPDTQVRKIGKQAFETALTEDSVSMTDYLLDHLSQKYNISSREGKARFLAQVSKLLAEMPDSIIKDQLMLDISQLTSVDVALLKQRKIGMQNSEPQQSFSRLSDREVRQTPVRFAITLLLHKPDLVAEVENPEQIALFDLPGANFLATLIETIEENPHINAAALLDRWRNTEYEASLVSLMKWQPESQNDEMLTREFRDCIRQIRNKAHELKLEKLLHKERIEGLDAIEKRDLIALLTELKP